jgi:hypothetical protein
MHGCNAPSQLKVIEIDLGLLILIVVLLVVPKHDSSLVLLISSVNRIIIVLALEIIVCKARLVVDLIHEM